MSDRLSDKLREYLMAAQSREVSLSDIRNELRIDPTSQAWHSLRKLMLDFVGQGLVKPTGKRDGTYKVIMQVKPVTVFGRQRRPPITLLFPKDFNTQDRLSFGEDITLRENDCILIAGQSNFGKTALCLNFCAENLDSHPVLMGNEYTTINGEPHSRFLNRLDHMDWVEWANGNGEDRFTLLPVRDDYETYVQKDKINIIDWINVDGEFYLISKILEGVKRNAGKGLVIVAIQKGEGATAGRGGQFTKDFADLEILLDAYSENEILLTLGKVKESKRRMQGRTYVFSLMEGVKITGFREVAKCSCNKGWSRSGKCEFCKGTGYVDKM